MDPIRMGMLGCGSVGDYALIQPAKEDGALRVTAVASRDAGKAAAHARAHNVPHSFGSYQALLDARVADAIYIALPNALHHRWTIAALDAGYPVLCEKPLACTVEEAEAMVAAATAAGQPLVEAFHWRHHPLAIRVGELLREGCIGTVTRIDAFFHIAAMHLAADNVRLDATLGGGSLLDQGCYCVDLVRFYMGAEPTVVTATSRFSEGGVDLATHAELTFADGRSASIDSAMDLPGSDLRCGAVFHGTAGTLEMHNPFLPHIGNHIVVRTDGGEVRETPTTTPSYIYQARAFATIVRDPSRAPDSAQMVEGMRLVTAIRDAVQSPGMRG